MVTSAIDGGGNNGVGGEDIKFILPVMLWRWIHCELEILKEKLILLKNQVMEKRHIHASTL